nr:ribonuclease H-like domain-containing protein [Tanacetum cinerariifolium]
MWKLRIKEYFQVQDYALWDVIENGNSFKPVPRTIANAYGTSTLTIPGPVTTEKKAQKRMMLKLEASILPKSGIVPVSAARQSSSRAVAPVSVARPIKTAASKPLVNVAKPRRNALQTIHSLSRRPFYQQTALKNRNLNNKVNAVKANSVNTAKGNKVTNVVRNKGINVVKSSTCWGSPQDALKDQGYFDSGCSKHMTGNISYLTDFKEHDGGYIAFGGGAKGGKITSKGTIRT